MKKSIAIIGLGQFGQQVAISMTQKEFEVIAIDKCEDIVDEVTDRVGNPVILDSTDERAMRSANVDGVDIAVVAIGSNVEASLLTTALLQRLDIDTIYVRSINHLQKSILRSMGIRHIVDIESEMGIQFSSMLSSGNMGRHIQISNRHSLMEIKVPKKFIGKTLKDLSFRRSYKVNVVGIKHEVPIADDQGKITYKTHMNDVPDPDRVLESSDTLLIMGSDEILKKHINTGEFHD